MTRVYWILLIICLSVMPLVACGDDDTDDHSTSDAGLSDTTGDTVETGGSYVTGRRSCQETAETFCNQYGFCSRPDIYPIDTCIVSVNTSCLEGLAEPDAQTEFTEAEHGACLDAIVDQTCTATLDAVTPTACEGMPAFVEQ